MLEGLTPPRNQTEYCKIADMAAVMTESDRLIFMAAVEDEEAWGASTLSIALRQRGTSVADTTITKHRKRACFCFRS